MLGLYSFLLVQERTKEHTRLNRFSALCCHFLNGKFLTRYAQTRKIFLKMPSWSGDLDGALKQHQHSVADNCFFSFLMSPFTPIF
ncbi:hypothetical protein HMPREF9095_0434 [Haemophilus aegyptius ATCC 11116]|nr:hypothetical protein HMPREF9095_0434 [Haemophilus aegyptius ATCC 11116]